MDFLASPPHAVTVNRHGSILIQPVAQAALPALDTAVPRSPAEIALPREEEDQAVVASSPVRMVIFTQSARRVSRLERVGTEALAYMFGSWRNSISATFASPLRPGFTVGADARITRTRFAVAESPLSRSGLSTIFPDGDEWLALLDPTDISARKAVWSDPDSALLAASGVAATPLRGRFHRTFFLNLSFVDDDARIERRGCCFRIEPGLLERSTNSGADNAKLSAFGVRAKAIVSRVVRNESVAELVWCGGDVIAAQDVRSAIESCTLPFVGCGGASVEFDSTQRLGEARINVSLQLVFAQQTQMFNDAPVAAGAASTTLLLDALALLRHSAFRASAGERALLRDVLPDVPADLADAAGAEEGEASDVQGLCERGVYAARFWYEGKWRVVAVDGAVDGSALAALAAPAGADAPLYRFVCTKAYEKLYRAAETVGVGASAGGGGVEGIGAVFEDLTGGIPFEYAIGLRSEGALGGADGSLALWQLLQERCGDGRSILAVSWRSRARAAATSTLREERREGTVSGRVYGVLAVADVRLGSDQGTERLVRMFDPYGSVDVLRRESRVEGNWGPRGARWSSLDDVDVARIGGAVSADDAARGVFVTTFATFIAVWETMVVTRVLAATPYTSGGAWKTWTVEGEWSSCRGDIADQFQVVLKEDCEVVVSLTQIADGSRFTAAQLHVVGGVAGGERAVRQFGDTASFGTAVAAASPQNGVRTISTARFCTVAEGPINFVPVVTSQVGAMRRYVLRIMVHSADATVIPV